MRRSVTSAYAVVGVATAALLVAVPALDSVGGLLGNSYAVVLILAAVVAAIGLARENERLSAAVRGQLDAVQQSRLRIVQAGDVERQRIERNLHDGAQQRLVAATLTLRRAERLHDVDAMRSMLAHSAREIETAVGELRELARGMNPRLLTEQGLDAALESLAERTDLPTTVTGRVGARLAAPVESAAYFAVAELLTNVTRHAAARRVNVGIGVDGSALSISVVDDGAGGAVVIPGGGLAGIHDRLEVFGGSLCVGPRDRGTAVGTRATIRLPVDGADR